MIFFDEMGLAEYSPNNPLKVIHSELEYDLNEGDNKVAFVGISNWRLDASKMNSISTLPFVSSARNSFSAVITMDFPSVLRGALPVRGSTISPLIV